jgi:hypothetical protein
MHFKMVWPLLAGLVVVGLSAGVAFGNNGDRNKTFEYAIGLWGDLPYSDVQAMTGVPNLIADMNNSAHCDRELRLLAAKSSIARTGSRTALSSEWVRCAPGRRNVTCRMRGRRHAPDHAHWPVASNIRAGTPAPTISEQRAPGLT